MESKFDKIISILMIVGFLAIATGIIYMAFFDIDSQKRQANDDRYFELKEREVALLEKLNGYLPEKPEREGGRVIELTPQKPEIEPQNIEP